MTSFVESSRSEDLLLSKSDLENYDNDCADIYFLTDREVDLLLSCLRYADWESRWTDRDKDANLVENLRRKLMLLCVTDLVKSQLLIYAALTGQDIDLSDSEAIATLLNSPQVFTDPKQAVVPAIDRVAGDSQDYSDELTNIGTILGFVAAV